MKRGAFMDGKPYFWQHKASHQGKPTYLKQAKLEALNTVLKKIHNLRHPTAVL